jgi:hypothetical protein
LAWWWCCRQEETDKDGSVALDFSGDVLWTEEIGMAEGKKKRKAGAQYLFEFSPAQQAPPLALPASLCPHRSPARGTLKLLPAADKLGLALNHSPPFLTDHILANKASFDRLCHCLISKHWFPPIYSTSHKITKLFSALLTI